jgi:hypothetical protein
MTRGYLTTANAALPPAGKASTSGIDTTSWRLSYYITGAVLIYGALERFVDETLVATARVLNVLISKYDDLPKIVREAHLDLTVQVMRSLDQPRWSELTAADLSRRLADCLNGVGSYELNVDIFKERPGNYRHRQIRESFRRLGVGIPEEVVTPGIDSVLDGKLSGKYARMSTLLDDLVERRNEAAHGLDIADVLDFKTLMAIVDAIEAYAYALRAYAVSALCFTCEESRADEVSSLGTLSHTWKIGSPGLRSLGEITQGAVESCVGDVVMVGDGAKRRVAKIGSIGWGSRRLKRAKPIAGRKIALEFGQEVAKHEPVQRLARVSAETLQPFAGW